MKTKKICVFATILAILCSFLLILAVPPKNFLIAENEQTETEQPEKFSGVTIGGQENGFDFSLTMTATTRNNTTPEAARKKVVDTTENQEVEYICFKWRDLKTLNFHAVATLNPSKTYLTYQLQAKYMRAENLSATLGNGTDENLIPATAISDPFIFDLTYHIDSNTTNVGSGAAIGHDFGLYKFNFVYGSSQDGGSPISIGEIYVAVIPDSLDEIDIPTDVRIEYEVHSSRKLMNAYDFGLNTNAFDYVNPDRLIWEVVGTDENGNNYVLNRQMQKQDEYAGYGTIYPSDQPNTGTQFHFDSNDIPGEWQVSVKIQYPDGTTKPISSPVSVSTIKKPKSNYLWLILLIIALVLLFTTLTILLIWLLHRKKEHVW